MNEREPKYVLVKLTRLRTGSVITEVRQYAWHHDWSTIRALIVQRFESLVWADWTIEMCQIEADDFKVLKRELEEVG